MQEKQTKRKLQEEVAKAVLAKNGVPLSISEHDSIIAKIKVETELARAELLEAMNVNPTSTSLVFGSFLHLNFVSNQSFAPGLSMVLLDFLQYLRCLFIGYV